MRFSPLFEKWTYYVLVWFKHYLFSSKESTYKQYNTNIHIIFEQYTRQEEIAVLLNIKAVGYNLTELRKKLEAYAMSLFCQLEALLIWCKQPNV